MKQILKYFRYNTREVATVLRLSEKTVRFYFRTGRLQGFKDGRRWYTTDEALSKYEFERFCERYNLEYMKAIKMFLNENGETKTYQEVIKELEKIEKKENESESGNDNGGSGIRDN